jgi:hypothetical protein
MSLSHSLKYGTLNTFEFYFTLKLYLDILSHMFEKIMRETSKNLKSITINFYLIFWEGIYIKLDLDKCPLHEY